MDLNKQGCFITFSVIVMEGINIRTWNVLIEDSGALSNLVTLSTYKMTHIPGIVYNMFYLQIRDQIGAKGRCLKHAFN